MRIKYQELIDELTSMTNSFIEEAEKMKTLPVENLNKKSDPNSWSALECLEHMSLYGDFYIPEFTKCLEKGKKPKSEYFRPGLFGNYSAKSMLPKEKLNKMNTFKDKNPLGSELDLNTINRFIGQQKAMLNLLDRALNVDLTRTKSKTTLPLIKFRLGDTFRFVIYHNKRHMVQAGNALKA